MSWLARGLALPTRRLFLHHGNSGPIHLHIQDGHRLADDDGQIQLQGFLDLSLLALGDIASDGLGDTLHGFGGHLQTGQELHLLATMIERSLLAHQSVHAAHPGRKLRIFDVQFDIHRKLAEVTLGAQVVGASHAHRTDDRQDGFGADFLVLGVVATSARQLTLIRRWGFELQQLVEGGGARLVESRSQGRLYRFQIGPAVLAALGKDTAEQLVYLPRHLLMARSSRFFSCSVQPPRCCSTGRSRQILSLRATRSWPSFWKRWNSATSCCALRSAVGLAKLSVTVLPATRRVRRNCGSCPGSWCLAQWQEGLPQRRITAVMEPGRRSPQLRNSSRSLDLWVPNVATSSGIRIPFCAAYYLCVYRRSELRHKKRKPAGWHFQVVHAAPKGFLTEAAEWSSLASQRL